MPLFISLGVSKEEFEDSAPVDLECYLLAENMARKRRDAENWQMGMYNMSAFSVVISRALAGRKSTAEYIDAPFMEKAEEAAREENMTEEEKSAEREKLLAMLMNMQTNFELNHGGDGG